MDSDLCLGIIIVLVLIFIIGIILISFPGLKGYLAMLVPIMIGLGTASRMLDKDDEENNKCRNCGHELDEDAIFCPNCGTKRI
ncbi:zinc ribbon domain-containing protein [uncultured Methanobrevibacter sp.]|uniref:zinc ribbon domain-containing protein n=1 Tax=uncultured Methanobrevibacter sp. TaxID=253161 RepID=UPI0025E100B9|nr:zinc ribbon domain-containing protein [uncultured Methanobrevibacter sp.]